MNSSILQRRLFDFGKRDLFYLATGALLAISIATSVKFNLVQLASATPKPTAENIAEAFNIKKEVAQYFITAGEQTNIDPYLLASLAKTESGFKLKAVSEKGYQGIMQTKPATMKHADVDILHGARELQAWLQYHRGDYYKAIASYKGGTKPKRLAFKQATQVMELYKEIRNL